MKARDVWKLASRAQQESCVPQLVAGGVALMRELPSPPSLRICGPDMSELHLPTFEFILQFLRRDPRAPAECYALFGRGPGDDKWEMIEGPWRAGEGPFHAWG